MFANSTFVMLETAQLKQVGCIVWDKGMDKRAWMDYYTAKGYVVVPFCDRAELYKPTNTNP